jgi:predicted transcriptional regulator of viral defense system
VKRIKKMDLAWGIEQEWRDGFKVLMAKPSRTVIDVLTFPDLGGGIQSAGDILREYMSDFDVPELVQRAIDHANGSAKKRLGFLLEQYGYENWNDLERLRSSISKGVIKLDPQKSNSGFRIMKWNILVNARIRSEDRS